MMSVALYVGLSESKWNGYEIPASIGYACVSPISGRSANTRKENWVTVPEGVDVIQDSGAFSDSWESRISLEAAWERQIAHSEKHGYSRQITHRASYDLLIDETWLNGKRTKKRWSYADAQEAVKVTIEASHFAAARRDKEGLIQSAQGVEAGQYLSCVKQVIPYIDPKRDKLGLGGWCILGIRRELMPVFEETVKLVIPYAARQGIRNVHIWGVVYPPALGLLLWWADQHEISVSTDSTSPSLQVVWGHWGYAEWRKKITPISPKQIGRARAIHVCQTKHYLKDLRITPHYTSHFAAARRDRLCVMCGQPVSDKALTCGARCRKAKSRVAGGGA